MGHEGSAATGVGCEASAAAGARFPAGSRRAWRCCCRPPAIPPICGDSQTAALTRLALVLVEAACDLSHWQLKMAAAAPRHRIGIGHGAGASQPHILQPFLLKLGLGTFLKRQHDSASCGFASCGCSSIRAEHFRLQWLLLLLDDSAICKRGCGRTGRYCTLWRYEICCLRLSTVQEQKRATKLVSYWPQLWFLKTSKRV